MMRIDRLTDLGIRNASSQDLLEIFDRLSERMIESRDKSKFEISYFKVRKEILRRMNEYKRYFDKEVREYDEWLEEQGDDI